MSDYRFLLSRRWIIGAVLVVVFAIVCHLLAQWQLDRRAQAQAEIARISNNYDAEPVPISEALPQLDSFDISQKWLPVELHGQYLSENEVLVRNRPCSGASGYDVLTPFRLDDGSVFFVDRGCVPGGSVANTAAEFAAAPSGEQIIVARLRAGEPIVAGRESSGNTVGSINLDSLASKVGLPAFTAAYGQLATATTAQAPYPAARPDPDEGPHLSYALQWYVFALIAAGAYVWIARQERRNRLSDAGGSEPSDGEQPPEPSAEARLSSRYGQSGAGGRRGEKRSVSSSDTEIEDSLVDSA